MSLLPRLTLLVAVALATTPLLPALAAPTPPSSTPRQANDRHKAVFEMSSEDPVGWDALLKNLENLVAHYGPANAEFEVVAHGQGIGIMLKTNVALAERMAALAKQGVVFAACNNTMKRKGIAREALLPFVTVVPAGVAEIIEKQEAGWAYLKSGR